jgi:hypothetical protein
MDIKGDLCPEYEKSGNLREAKVINFREETGCTIDPLNNIRESGDDNKVASIKEIVFALIPLSVRITDPFWKESPRCLVTAAMGMCAVVAIHEGRNENNPAFNNPHMHVLLTTRPINSEGNGFDQKKERNWNKRSYVTLWREQLATMINNAYERNGLKKSRPP